MGKVRNITLRITAKYFSKWTYKDAKLYYKQFFINRNRCTGKCSCSSQRGLVQRLPQLQPIPNTPQLL